MTISFPRLGIDLVLDRVAFSIFGFPVYWYGIIIALGFAMGILAGVLGGIVGTQ